MDLYRNDAGLNGLGTRGKRASSDGRAVDFPPETSAFF